ncbi:NUMOD4 domain-containing protein [Tetragenococcus koreensis]|uniref:NUMOD4 domain-containing protein n=1 Tax=Tetragenococcus koreensis TaxID=290335 RepID=UPI001F2E8D32|nr:NUMOD4 domain-containing protein [Tetragenococcus koreensis]MCF1632931.1 NUMOD4 domain-containing protein [Tetragenococcus koreensis]
MKEIWRTIVGYEGFYEVSSLGKVRSLKRSIEQKGDVKHIRVMEGRVLKHNLDRNGYHKVVLSKNGKTKTFKIHRLVAKAFILNTDNLPQVNHIDEDKTNNCVSNLEWCTAKQNINYGTRIKRQRVARGKKVEGIDSKGNIVFKFGTIREAAKYGFSHQCISACARGRNKKHKGLTWKYC